jgi:hypothetical protein
MRKIETINRFGPRGARPVEDYSQRGTVSDTLDNFRKRLTALESATGVKPPVPSVPPKPVPPMGRPADIPRTTTLVSTAESRALEARRAGRAEVQRQHNVAGRFFAAPRDDGPVPRASRTGPVV